MGLFLTLGATLQLLPLLNRYVGPVKTASRQQHVPYQGLYGGLPHQTDKEKLLYDGRRDGAEGGQAEQELPEPVGLVGILAPHILLQSTLRFLLQTFDMGNVRQTASICRQRECRREKKESIPVHSGGEIQLQHMEYGLKVELREEGRAS